VVAGGDAGDVRSDGLDDARSLVAEDSGQGEGQTAARHTEVGVAQAGRHHADEDFAGAGLVECDIGERERRA
jgi:hypothetical protein